MLIAIAGYNFPINVSIAGANTVISIPEGAGICNSGMGQLGQAFSGEAVKLCSEWNIMLYGLYGSALLGIVLIIAGAIVPGKKEDDYEREVEDDAIDILEKRYAKGELSKEEFDKMKKDLE